MHTFEKFVSCLTVQIFGLQKGPKMSCNRSKINVFSAIVDLCAFLKVLKYYHVLQVKHYIEKRFESKQILSA